MNKATYSVELAVCFENGSWELYNVKIKLRPSQSDASTILRKAQEQLDQDFPNLKYCSVGLYHYLNCEADE